MMRGRRKPNKIYFPDFWRQKQLVFKHSGRLLVGIGEVMPDGSERMIFIRKSVFRDLMRKLSGNRNLRVCLAKRCEAFRLGICTSEKLYAECLKRTKRRHPLAKELTRLGRKKSNK